MEATATFGNLFVALGLSQEAAATLSPDIVQLASDLASFNNIGVEEAVEKLRSGLVGEAEPLRTLGVNINEALVQAKALELGLVTSAGAATEAGKVQARYALDPRADDHRARGLRPHRGRDREHAAHIER